MRMKLGSFQPLASGPKILLGTQPDLGAQVGLGGPIEVRLSTKLPFCERFQARFTRTYLILLQVSVLLPTYTIKLTSPRLESRQSGERRTGLKSSLPGRAYPRPVLKKGPTGRVGTWIQYSLSVKSSLYNLTLAH